MPFKPLLVTAAVLALAGAAAAPLMEEEGIGWSFVGHGPAQLVAPQLDDGHNAPPWTSTRSTR